MITALYDTLKFPNKERTPQLACISNENLSPLTSIIKDDKLIFSDSSLDNNFYMKIYCGGASTLTIGKTLLSVVTAIVYMGSY